jgi:hypothetical protein
LALIVDGMFRCQCNGFISNAKATKLTICRNCGPFIPLPCLNTTHATQKLSSSITLTMYQVEFEVPGEGNSIMFTNSSVFKRFQNINTKTWVCADIIDAHGMDVQYITSVKNVIPFSHYFIQCPSLAVCPLPFNDDGVM